MWINLVRKEIKTTIITFDSQDVIKGIEKQEIVVKYKEIQGKV